MRYKFKIFIAVVAFDLLLYPLLYFFLLPNTDKLGVNLSIACIRILGCFCIGLWGAYQNRAQSISPKKAIWISIVASLFALYYLFSDLYISLIDLVWWGEANEFYQSSHFVRIFLSENLFDQWTVLSYVCLLVTLYIGQLYFSRRTVSIG